MGMLNRGEADYRIIVALVVLVVLGLLIIWLFSQHGGVECPDEAFECNSPCGCCVLDALGNQIDYCDYSVCGQGYVMNPKGECCSVDNPQECLAVQQACVNPASCGEQDSCCAGYVCSDGECAPCEAGLLCDPQDVQSCCSDYACNAQGRCELLEGCSDKPCDEPGERCKICDSSGNCADCTDNSYCAYDSLLNRNVCKQQGACPAGYVQCDNCDTGCCAAATGECASCSGAQCSPEQIGQQCSVCDASGTCVECSDSVCANVLGTYTCADIGACPEGYYSCAGCDSGCCDVNSGDCASCENMLCAESLVGQQCSVCDASGTCVECAGSVCAKTLPDSETYSCMSAGDCPPGFVYDPACPYECRDASTGACASEEGEVFERGDIEFLCIDLSNLIARGFGVLPLSTGSIACTSTDEQGENEWTTFTEDQFNDWMDNPDLPSWVFETESPEICVDNYYECNYDGAMYDLNGDELLNTADLQIFDAYCGENIGSSESYAQCTSLYDRRFDFNGDGKVDAFDRQCMRDVCEDGTCKVVDITTESLCFNSKLLTAEQKYLLGTQLYGNVSDTFNIYLLGFGYSQRINIAFKELADYLTDIAVPDELKPAVASTGVLVMRGSPYIKGQEKYYSGCSYLEWRYMIAAPYGATNPIRKIFLLGREPDCSTKVNPVITSFLYEGIRHAQLNLSMECMHSACEGNYYGNYYSCASTADSLCSKLLDDADKYACKDVFRGLWEGDMHPEGVYASRCDWFSNEVISLCANLICAQNYDECSSEASIISSCESLKQQTQDACIDMFTEYLLDAYSSAYEGMNDQVAQECDTLSEEIYGYCISSRNDCVVEADAFGNLALNSMLSKSISLLDADSGISSTLDAVNMDSISVAQVTTVSCSYYEDSKP